MLKRILPILLFLTACSNDLPKNVLPPEKMEKILWDVALGGEYANGYVLTKNYQLNRAALNNKLLEKIYKVHRITKEQFDKSLEYYKSKPKQLIVILDSIAEQKTRLQNEKANAPNIATPPGTVIQPNTPPNISHRIPPKSVQ